MFKVGDLVKCVDAIGASLQHGYVYKVEEVSDDKEFVRVFDYELDDIGGEWFSSRFVRAKPSFKGNR